MTKKTYEITANNTLVVEAVSKAAVQSMIDNGLLVFEPSMFEVDQCPKDGHAKVYDLDKFTPEQTAERLLRIALQQMRDAAKLVDKDQVERLFAKIAMEGTSVSSRH